MYNELTNRNTIFKKNRTIRIQNSLQKQKRKSNAIPLINADIEDCTFTDECNVEICRKHFNWSNNGENVGKGEVKLKRGNYDMGRYRN